MKPFHVFQGSLSESSSRVALSAPECFIALHHKPQFITSLLLSGYFIQIAVCLSASGKATAASLCPQGLCGTNEMQNFHPNLTNLGLTLQGLLCKLPMGRTQSFPVTRVSPCTSYKMTTKSIFNSTEGAHWIVLRLLHCGPSRLHVGLRHRATLDCI